MNKLILFICCIVLFGCGVGYCEEYITYEVEPEAVFALFERVEELENRIVVLEDAMLYDEFSKAACICGKWVKLTPYDNECPYCEYKWIVLPNGWLKDPRMVKERDEEGRYLFRGRWYSYDTCKPIIYEPKEQK